MKGLAEFIPDNIRAAMEAQGLDPEALYNQPIPQPVYACAICEDLGVVAANGLQPGEPGFGRLFPCPNPHCVKGNETRNRAAEAKYKNAGIPPHYQGLTFDSWDALPESDKVGKLPAAAAAYLFATKPDHKFTRSECYEIYNIADPSAHLPDRAKNCVMLFGAVGMGKTGLMASAANLILANGGSIVYIRVVDLIEAIQSRYGATEYPTSESIVRDFKTFPLLFLDEFQVVNDRPDRLEKIESIIEARRAAYLPTFMTGNLNQDEFRAAWGDRAADRVISSAHWIPVGGEKLRQTEQPFKAV